MILYHFNIPVLVLRRFGQFMVSLLPSPSVNEAAVSLDEVCVSGRGDTSETSVVSAVYNIQLRNMCLNIVWQLLTAQPSNCDINQQWVSFHVCLPFVKFVHTCHAFIRIRESAQTVRNGAKVVGIRYTNHGGRYCFWIRRFVKVNVNKDNIFTVSYIMFLFLFTC